MRKKISLTNGCLVLAVLLMMFQSCSKDNFESEETSIELQKQSLVITPVVERLMEMGYDLDDIRELDNFYVVEGDLAFSKNIKDYKKPQNSNARHYHSTNLVGSNFINNILVFSEISGEIIIDPNGNTWRNAIDQAIDAWNLVGEDSCIRFELTTIPFLADITIKDDTENPLDSDQFGLADTPPISGGAPFDTVWINLSYSDTPPFDTTLIQKRNIIAHELGHCIGFKHTDNDYTQQPIDGAILVTGTGASTDPLSIMLDNLNFLNNPTILSPTDIFAARTLYGGCVPISATISGPSSICSRSETYTLDGNATATSWATSSNLQILNSNSTSATVSLNGSSTQPIGGTYVEAILSNGDTERKNIQIEAPTPYQTPVITGPNLLKYYQSGAFYTSNTNFDNYTNVEWVVFSYSFPNAGQHFQIQATNNNDFHVVVEVLPTAPEGNYTVQCRVSNDCGTYYIDKSFTVEKGPPEIFEF